MDYRVDLASLFERFDKQLSIYAGATVFYRVYIKKASQDETACIDKFHVVGFFRNDKALYAVIQPLSSESGHNPLDYIDIMEFMTGNIFTNTFSAQLCYQELQQSLGNLCFKEV